MYVFLDVAATASSHKIFPILLIIGWIVVCLAVLYIVFVFAWVLYPMFKCMIV